jgi:hypothetical protein
MIPTIPRPRRRPIPTIAALALALAPAGLSPLAACSSVKMPRGLAMIHTPRGDEQGISTQYGIVFLGRTAREGRCDVTIYFGDGPSIEPGRIEVVDADLCLALLEIKSPTTEVSYTYPDPEDDLLLGIVGEAGPEFYVTRLATDMGVEGTAVHVPSGFPLSPSIVGAGIYRFEDFRFRLVGVVNGVAHFQDKIGLGHDVFTFLGPRNLARVAIYDRDRGRPKESPVRTDIIR